MEVIIARMQLHRHAVAREHDGAVGGFSRVREERPRALELPFQKEDKASEEDKEYIFKKYEDIRAHLDEIDALLNEKVDKWKTTRMPKVDLAILRLAVYEIKFEEDIPEGVSINEAVELAKLYGTLVGKAGRISTEGDGTGVAIKEQRVGGQ